jgi:hypothetical protein
VPDSSTAQRTGRLAVLSGVIGLVAFACLIAALAAPPPLPGSLRRETNYFRWQDAGVILQALTMIPVTLGVYRLTVARSPEWSRLCLILGLFAQAALITSSALIFTHTTADMLYMAPQGLVGLWLLLINRKRDGIISSSVAWTGRVAGTGLLLIGTGFVLYGAMVAPAVFVRPLSNGEIDAQSWTQANVIAHVGMAAGTLLGRAIYPIWAVLLGRRLLKITHAESDGLKLASA